MNENLQAEDEQIENELFTLLFRNLMGDDCNGVTRTDEDVFVYSICLLEDGRGYIF